MRDVSLPPRPRSKRRKRWDDGWLCLLAVLHAIQAAPLLLFAFFAPPQTAILLLPGLPHAFACLGLLFRSPDWWRIAIAAETLLLAALLLLAAHLAVGDPAHHAAAPFLLIPALLPFTALLLLLRRGVRELYASPAPKR